MQMRHEVRLGWGDQLFESLVWHNPTNIITTKPESFLKTYQEDYDYNQHLWAEYQYRHNEWFSYGGMIDMSEVSWNNVTRNGIGKILSRNAGHYFYNVVLMPTIRFTYFHHEYVNMYFGIGAGMGINGGTETNAHGKKTDVGLALNLSVIGLSVNYNRWFMTFDFGGLYSLKGMNNVFMLSSRMFSLGIGARF